MKKYKVKITETLQREVEVKADSYDDAINKVSCAWEMEEYVLGADDFVGVTFS